MCLSVHVCVGGGELCACGRVGVGAHVCTGKISLYCSCKHVQTSTVGRRVQVCTC